MLARVHNPTVTRNPDCGCPEGSIGIVDAEGVCYCHTCWDTPDGRKCYSWVAAKQPPAPKPSTRPGSVAAPTRPPTWGPGGGQSMVTGAVQRVGLASSPIATNPRVASRSRAPQRVIFVASKDIRACASGPIADHCTCTPDGRCEARQGRLWAPRCDEFHPTDWGQVVDRDGNAWQLCGPEVVPTPPPEWTEPQTHHCRALAQPTSSCPPHTYQGEKRGHPACCAKPGFDWVQHPNLCHGRPVTATLADLDGRTYYLCGPAAGTPRRGSPRPGVSAALPAAARSSLPSSFTPEHWARVSKVTPSLQSVSQQGQTPRGGCPGQIRCADGRCVDSVTQCDLRVTQSRTPSGQAQVRTAMIPNPTLARAALPAGSFPMPGAVRGVRPTAADCRICESQYPGYTCCWSDLLQIAYCCPDTGGQVTAAGRRTPQRPPRATFSVANPCDRLFYAGGLVTNAGLPRRPNGSIAHECCEPGRGGIFRQVGAQTWRCDALPTGGAFTKSCEEICGGDLDCLERCRQHRGALVAPGPRQPARPGRAMIAAPTQRGRGAQTTLSITNPGRIPAWMHAVFGQPVPKRNPRASNPCTSDAMCGLLLGPGYACRNGQCVYVGAQVAAGGTTRAGACSYDDVVERGCSTEIDDKGNVYCKCPQKDVTAAPGTRPSPPRPPSGIQVRPLGTITARQQAQRPAQAQVIGSGPISAQLAALNPYASDPNPGGMRTPGQMWWSPTGFSPWAWRPPSAPAVPWGAYAYYGNIWPWNGVTAPMPNPGFHSPPHLRQRRNPVYRNNPPTGGNKPIFGQPTGKFQALPSQWFYYQSPTTMGAPPFGGPVAAPGPPPGVFGLGGICYSNLDCGENEYCHQGVCLPVIDPTKPQGNPGTPRTQSPFPRRQNPGGMTSQTVPLAPGIPLR